MAVQVLGVEHSLLVKRATVVLKARVARAAELLASVGFVLVHDLSKNLQARSCFFSGKVVGVLKWCIST